MHFLPAQIKKRIMPEPEKGSDFTCFPLCRKRMQNAYFLSQAPEAIVAQADEDIKYFLQCMVLAERREAEVECVGRARTCLPPTKSPLPS